jgi:hypothetical protein
MRQRGELDATEFQQPGISSNMSNEIHRRETSIL